jgi:hypothetical protein
MLEEADGCVSDGKQYATQSVAEALSSRVVPERM